MSYDPKGEDPFYEPEDSGSFFQIPEGIQPAEIQEVIFTKDASDKLKSVEIKWYFEQFKDKTDFPTCRSWFYVQNPFGRSLFTAALENLGVPHEIPDLSAVKKEDGQPRKTFIKALKNEITGQFTDENMVKRKALLTIFHAWKCPDCGIVNRMNLKECPAKKGEICEHVRDNTEKVYPQVDTQGIYSVEHLNEAKVAEEIDSNLNKESKEREKEKKSPLPF